MRLKAMLVGDCLDPDPFADFAFDPALAAFTMSRPNDTKDRLLAAALDLVWASSYGSVSVDDICERAGVKKGSFYHFFASKADLALAAYEAHWREKRPEFDAMFSAQVPPLERLERLARFTYETQKEMFRKHGQVCGCPFANLGVELSTQDERLRAKSQEMMDHTLTYLVSAIGDAAREGLIECPDIKGTAQKIHSYVLGEMVQAKVNNDPETLRGLAGTIMGMLRSRVAA